LQVKKLPGECVWKKKKRFVRGYEPLLSDTLPEMP
jgi:hypothetical protein